MEWLGCPRFFLDVFGAGPFFYGAFLGSFVGLVMILIPLALLKGLLARTSWFMLRTCLLNQKKAFS